MNPLILFVAYVAVLRFGWLNGLAISATIVLLMPWGPKYTARAFIEGERKRAEIEAKRR